MTGQVGKLRLMWKRARRRAGMTQEDLAREMEVSVRTVMRAEAGGFRKKWYGLALEAVVHRMKK